MSGVSFFKKNAKQAFHGGLMFFYKNVCAPGYAHSMFRAISIYVYILHVFIFIYNRYTIPASQMDGNIPCEIARNSKCITWILIRLGSQVSGEVLLGCWLGWKMTTKQKFRLLGKDQLIESY